MVYFPRSNLLKCWIFWILIKSANGIAHLIYKIGNSNNGSDLATLADDFISGFIAPWFYGANASSFWLIVCIAIFLDIYIASVILFGIDDLSPSIKKVIWILFGLAMYTIWLEPWLLIALLHPGEWLKYFISEIVFKGALFIPDIGFSILWFYWTCEIHGSLNNEF